MSTELVSSMKDLRNITANNSVALANAMRARISDHNPEDKEAVGYLVRSLLCYNEFLKHVEKLMTATRGCCKTEIGAVAVDFLKDTENGRYAIGDDNSSHSVLFQDLIDSVSKNTFYGSLIESAGLVPSRCSMRPFDLLVYEASTTPVVGIITLYGFYAFYDGGIRESLRQRVELLQLNPREFGYFMENADIRGCLSSLLDAYKMEAELSNFNASSVYRVLSQVREFFSAMFDVKINTTANAMVSPAPGAPFRRPAELASATAA